ncbi:hypothetical protein RJ639_039679, partial [Escallonia herrerae]
MKPGEEAVVTPRQCSSIIRVERKNNVRKECDGIIKHFQEKATLDDIYYFAADLARDGSLRSVFWADGRSRASYAQFGDVVVFYTGWVDLNEKYDVKGNFWIQNMYNLLAHWAKSFLNDTFFAGMTASGQSESIHSFFDRMAREKRAHASTSLSRAAPEPEPIAVEFDRNRYWNREALDRFSAQNASPLAPSLRLDTPFFFSI